VIEIITEIVTPTSISNSAFLEKRRSFTISPRLSREFCITSRTSEEKRAQGMPGARSARSLACKMNKTHEIVTTVTPVQSGIPRAMVLTVSFALSPVTGLFCHCRKRNAQALSPLDASVGASGPHDFAVREACTFVSAPLASTASRRPRS
jgi:hypothetical protein